MRKSLAIFVCVMLLGRISAQVFPANEITAQSRSGLFTVHGPKIANASLYSNNFLGNNPLKIDPALLAVSCEQIKELLLTELGYSMRRQIVGGNRSMGLSKIFLVLHPNPDAPIAISLVPSGAGQGYRVDMPNEMFSSRIIEVITQVLLLDIAGQHSKGQSVNLPLWLVDGFVGHLQSRGLETLPLQANLPVTKVRVHSDRVSQIHQHLHGQLPLTFEELSWPEKLTKERMAVFNDSAELFVYELLHLKEGRNNFRRMLEKSPEYKNWQFAFLEAFRADFGQLVEVEKWWALTLVDFTGRDPFQIWSRDESLKQMEAALKIPALVHATPNALPTRAELSLQKVITEWDLSRQENALLKVIGQLNALRLRVAPEFVPLLDEYRVALEKYLKERGQTNFSKTSASSSVVLKKSANKELDRCDKERAALRNSLTVTSK